MPLYDFRCPHGHKFEYFCRMSDRLEKIPCEGKVNQLVVDEIADQARELLGDGVTGVVDVDGTVVMIQRVAMENSGPPNGDSSKAATTLIAVAEIPCMLKAELYIGRHSNPAGMLDHGLATNRDAAREGRYDPVNPSRRFISKGRSWRK